jgi:hypothetical protein
MSKTINGRKPVSSKPKAQSMRMLTDDIFGNALALPPDLQKELEDQQLVGRFVSSKVLYANQGYHPKGWKPYKRKGDATMGGVELKFGSDPDGLVRRGDCILAVKTIEEHAKHKMWLEAKADRYKGHTKQKQKELQEQARAAGASSYVSEGYDGDDEEETD